MSSTDATERARQHADQAEQLLAQLQGKRPPHDVVVAMSTRAAAHATLAVYYQRAS